MDKLPKRKKLRLDGYDYSQGGSYFVTICSDGRREVFGKIEVGDGALDVPKIILSDIGEVVQQTILSSKNMQGIHIDSYVIMPNHIHILITVSNGTSGAPSPTNNVIPRFVGALKRLSNRKAGRNVFQRSFYDHIIRDERDYITHLGYINDNPAKWKQDEYYV